ncbi:hypothetical protein HGRIS_011307 [Hohenbuehelia grisea]|uniref:Uncharacterized protein n=1 Tax=Hohenbuehelia grisea TaxID=104357 RepID=A0ABR3JWW0_9AGAR
MLSSFSAVYHARFGLPLNAEHRSSMFVHCRFRPAETIPKKDFSSVSLQYYRSIYRIEWNTRSLSSIKGHTVGLAIAPSQASQSSRGQMPTAKHSHGHLLPSRRSF